MLVYLIGFLPLSPSLHLFPSWQSTKARRSAWPCRGTCVGNSSEIEGIWGLSTLQKIHHAQEEIGFEYLALIIV
jgi:hypothetical protein